METCRTCAKCDFDYESQWFDLFNCQRWKKETERIHIELNIWKIKLSCNDGLPQKICPDCFTKFCTISLFRVQCMEAQTKLNQIFDKIDTQSIQDDDDDDDENNEQTEQQKLVAQEKQHNQNFDDNLNIEVNQQEHNAINIDNTQTQKHDGNTATIEAITSLSSSPSLSYTSATSYDSNMYNETNNTNTTTAPAMSTTAATTTTNSYTHHTPINTTVVVLVKPIESNFIKEKSNSSNNNVYNNYIHNNNNNNNENIQQFLSNDNNEDNTEVSFRAVNGIPDTAIMDDKNDIVEEYTNSFIEENDLEEINNTIKKFVRTTTLPEDTNDLDENDLIEELIDELDIIEEIDEDERVGEGDEEEEREEQEDCDTDAYCVSYNNEYTNIDDSAILDNEHESAHNNADRDHDNVNHIFNVNANDDDHVNDAANEITITFECKYCFKWKNRTIENFLTQQELLAHITQHHSNEQPYNCPYCRQCFMDAASRTTHVKDEHSQKVYECETCSKRYADKFNLRNHIEKYHSGTDFDCNLCEKSFCSRKSLNYHMKWHNPADQLKCSYCDRLFINQRHLKIHEETHTGYRSQEVCSYCGKNFFHLKTLRWHIYRQHGGEKPYKCSRCPEVFISYFEKRIHMLENHLDNLTLIEKTECMMCHKRYDNDSLLKDHMLEDHKENKGTVKIANNKRVIMNKKPKSFTGLFQCEKCDKRFNMKSALDRHMAVHSTEGRPHACPQCPKRFKRSQDVRWHLKTHSLEKPNICDVCGKGFALKYVLTQHRRSHEVLEKNFICSTCGRSYLFEKSLRLHERIHTGKTYYKCDLCSESFVTHIKFKWHMKKMHDEEDVAAQLDPFHNNNNNKHIELPLDDLVNIVIT